MRRALKMAAALCEITPLVGHCRSAAARKAVADPTNTTTAHPRNTFIRRVRLPVQS